MGISVLLVKVITRAMKARFKFVCKLVVACCLASFAPETVFACDACSLQKKSQNLVYQNKSNIQKAPLAKINKARKRALTPSHEKSGGR